MLIERGMNPASMKTLKSQIDNKIQRILWMVQHRKTTNSNKKSNLNRTIGVQTYFHDSHHKDIDSTFLTSKIDSLDISGFSDVKEHSGARKPQYGRSYAVKSKIQTQFPHQKVTRKLLQEKYECQDDNEKIHVNSKLDTHNIEFEQQIRKRKNSNIIHKPKRNMAVNQKTYEEMMKKIMGRKETKREQLPLTNFVRDRLLKRVLQASQRQDIVEP